MRISRWVACALVLAVTAGTAVAQTDENRKNVADRTVRPGQQDPKTFVIDSPVPPPRAPGAKIAGLPDPYREDDNWAKMPAGSVWGGASGVSIDRDGKSVWFAQRCGTQDNGCSQPENKNVDPILKFDSSGKLVKSFGAGMFKFPRSLQVDKNGNLWIVDGSDHPGRNGKPLTPDLIGNTVREFSPDGKVLMTIGTPGVSGTGQYTFSALAAAIVAPNGDIYVVDGYDPNTNARVIKYDSHGKYITEWGKYGTGPTDFSSPHGIALDSKGNVYIADRGNQAIKVFDPNGKLLHVWGDFGIPSGVFIDKNDRLYVADSNWIDNPGYDVAGVRIVDITNGKIVANIPFGEDNGLENVAVDANGTVYGSFVHKPGSHRWFKK